jgi:hypothetical protein
LDRVKCICGHPLKFWHAAIRFCTEELGHWDLPDQGFEWCHTAHGEVMEAIPKDAPEPLGK